MLDKYCRPLPPLGWALYASRVNYNPRTEWALKQSVLDDIVKTLGPVDQFASAINHKLDNYVYMETGPKGFAL